MQHWQRQHAIFLSLVLGIFILSGLLAVRYDRAWDLTQNQRNQLSDTSVALMQQLKSPLNVTAFSRGNPKVKALINRVLARYQQHGDIRWQFKNPDSEIDAVREYGISRDGELLLTYQGQSLRVDTLNETAISRGIYTLLQGKTRQVVFLSGHGERHFDASNAGYATLKSRLRDADIETLAVDIQRSGSIPDNADLVVIADPKHPYSEKAVAAIAEYLNRGGRLLWLAGVPQPALTRLLGAQMHAGKLMTTSGKDYGLDNPRYVPIVPPANNRPALLQNIDTILVFPSASPVTVLPTSAAEQWHAQPVITTSGTLLIKTGETITQASSPVTVGLTLSPQDVAKNQRVWLFGDADFASNGFIGVGQNADFTQHLFSQLSAPDNSPIQLADSAPPPVILSAQTLAYLGLLFIILVPLGIYWLGSRVRRRLQQ